MILMSGCAFGNRHLVLTPVHMDSEPSVVSAKSEVQVVPPVDKRTSQTGNWVGNVRNGIGKSTAKLLTDKSPGEWVESSLIENLKNAGFKVNDGKLNPMGLCVETTIRRVECGCGLVLRAKVVLDIELKDKNVVFFKSSFAGNGSRLNWVGARGEFESTLTRAMRDCMNKAMPVLIKELSGR